MNRFVPACALLGALSLCTARAHALRPDFDGERGVEFHLTLGVGSLFETSERVFLSPANARGNPTQPNALNPGFSLRFGAGYRPMAAFSVGLYGDLQTLGAEGIPRAGGTGFDAAAALAFSVGVYGRLYFLWVSPRPEALRRVSFESAGDGRRFDPWVSLGLGYHGLWRTSGREGTTQTAAWAVQSFAIPISAGFDYRVVPELALTVAAGVTPLVGTSVTRTDAVDRPGGRVVTSETYGPVADVNAQWFVGLGARYTFTP